MKKLIKLNEGKFKKMLIQSNEKVLIINSFEIKSD